MINRVLKFRYLKRDYWLAHFIYNKMSKVSFNSEEKVFCNESYISRMDALLFMQDNWKINLNLDVKKIWLRANKKAPISTQD